MLMFLQENAQWLCAIGMVIFAGIQVWMMSSQNRQQVRLRRLDLANQFGTVLAQLDDDFKSINQMSIFIYAHYAEFICLLNEKDMAVFKEFVGLIRPIVQETSIIQKQKIRNQCQQTGLQLLETLGAAKYGIVKPTVQTCNKKRKAN